MHPARLRIGTPIRVGLITLVVIIAAMLAAGRASVSGAASPLSPSTPELIDAALARGEITAEQRLRYLGYAIAEPRSLPAQYQGTRGWSGTTYLAEIRAAGLASAPSGYSAAARGELARLTDLAATVCDKEDGATTTDTANFRIVHGTVGGGLTASDYGTALETAYTKEITEFGWPKPPLAAANNFGKFPIQVDSSLGQSLYGYVVAQGGSYAGFVGNNPNTTATETDAYASCMVVNADLTFVGTDAAVRRNGLNVTMAHEFFHMVQMGVGPLANSESSMWSESTAAHVENEVFSTSNDAFQYLWPRYRECLTAYPAVNNSQYSNFLFFRYAAERTGGIATVGGGERLMALNLANIGAGQNALTAFSNALVSRGTTMNDTLHNFAVSARFMKMCPNGSPYCFGDATRMTAANGTAVTNDAAIADVGLSATGSVKNTYAANFIGLPTTGTYTVALSNNSATGSLRGSIVADMGTSVTVTALPTTADGNATATSTAYTVPTGAVAVALVITNQQANPTYGTCVASNYTVTVSSATAAPTATPSPSPTPGSLTNRLFVALSARNIGLN